MTNLFVRKATGLVRSWSVFDAFIYALFSINLITLGLYSFSQMYYFQGGLIPALIVSALFIIFEVVVYAALIAVMPRSGGDYVWQSRILGAQSASSWRSQAGGSSCGCGCPCTVTCSATSCWYRCWASWVQRRLPSGSPARKMAHSCPRFSHLPL